MGPPVRANPRGFLAVLAFGTVLTSCSPATDGQAVSVYTRNDSLVPYMLWTDPERDPAMLVPVAGGGNCNRLALPWTLVVSVDDGDLAAQEVARLTSADLQPLPEVAVWVHVLADGATVQTGTGIPPWWAGQPQLCG